MKSFPGWVSFPIFMQKCSLHDWTSNWTPGHLVWSIKQSVFIVPCLISVMQHVRPLENVPLPQVFVQDDHSSHSDQYGHGSKSQIFVSSPVSRIPNDVSTVQNSWSIGLQRSPKNIVQQFRVRVFVASPHVAEIIVKNSDWVRKTA